MGEFVHPTKLGEAGRYGYRYLWVGSCLVSAVWVYFCLPETKDRTFYELDELVSILSHPSSTGYPFAVAHSQILQFEARIPGRKFRKHPCVHDDPDTGEPVIMQISQFSRAVDKEEGGSGSEKSKETIAVHMVKQAEART